MTNVAIRLLRESDLPFVHRGISETNWQDIPDDQKAVLKREDCDRRVLDDFDRYMKNERFKFKVFVASSEQGEPMGYVSVGESVNPAVGLRLGAVLDFWVDPELRNRGIGSKLLDHALDYIRSQGYSHSSIPVSASNQRAIQMYERRGFRADRINLAKKLT